MPEPEPSPLADEAGRFFGAVQEWARQNFPAGRDGHLGPECEWCPLCRLMAVVRGDRPDVTQRVAEAGVTLLGAVRAVVDAASAPPAERPQAPRVQHIDLDDG